MDADNTRLTGPSDRRALQVDNAADLERLEIFDGKARERSVRREDRFPRRQIRSIKANPRLWQGKWMPAFWTITGVFSLLVNIVLLAILLGLGRELFALKDVLSGQLLGGLEENFSSMDAAVISTTVTVNHTITIDEVIIVSDSIPVVFDLEVSERTNENIDTIKRTVEVRHKNRLRLERKSVNAVCCLTGTKPRWERIYGNELRKQENSGFTGNPGVGGLV